MAHDDLTIWRFGGDGHNLSRQYGQWSKTQSRFHHNTHNDFRNDRLPNDGELVATAYTLRDFVQDASCVVTVDRLTPVVAGQE